MQSCVLALFKRALSWQLSASLSILAEGKVLERRRRRGSCQTSQDSKCIKTSLSTWIKFRFRLSCIIKALAVLDDLGVVFFLVHKTQSIK